MRFESTSLVDSTAGGEIDAARDTLIGVARDANAPNSVRADAYDELLQLVGRELDDWKAAGPLHDEWVRLRPSDTRVQAWAPTIANRRRRSADA